MTVVWKEKGFRMFSFTHRILAIILLCSMVAGTAPAGQLKRIELNQNGKTVVYYRIGGQQYRAVTAAGLTRIKPGVRVCVMAKLYRVEGKNVKLYGSAFAGIRFVLSSPLDASIAPGANLCLGGTVTNEDGRTVMQIKVVETMADDITLFRQRMAALVRNTGAQPEDFYQLGWHLTAAKKVVSGLSVKEFKQYDICARQAFGRGVRLEAANLAKPTAAMLARLVSRYRNLVDSNAGVILQGHADWHVDAYRRFLHEHNATANLLIAGKEPKPRDLNRMLGSLYLLHGRMYLRYLDDKQAATSAYLAGIGFSPDDPDLAKELRSLGYVKFDRHWVTAARAKELRKKKEQAARNQAMRKARQAEARKRMEAQVRLRSGTGMEKKTTVVDAKLSRPSEDNIVELATLTKNLPEDVARYAVWRVAGLGRRAAVTQFGAALLMDKRPQVRMDAIDLLLALGGAEEITIVAKYLRKEQTPAVIRHAILAIQHMPKTIAIPTLIRVLASTAIPARSRKLVSQILAIETGQKFGMDAFSWKQWWKKHQ